MYPNRGPPRTPGRRTADTDAVYPGVQGVERPDHLAHVMAGSGRRLTHAQLDRRSIELACLLRARGLRAGDTLVMVSENRLEWTEVAWAGMRSGLSVAPLSPHLTQPELADAMALASPAALIASSSCSDAARGALGAHRPRVALAVDGGGGFEDYDTAVAAHNGAELTEERLGSRMVFSSGSTGRPKAIRVAASDVHPREAGARLGPLTDRLGIDARTVLLSPAPCYHAAPFSFSMATQGAGGTVVTMERFDALEALEAIERHRATHVLAVPTMLVRLLRLEPEQRDGFDLHSLRVAITGAAPCPAEVKQRILDWWGPVLHEYYGAAEGYGQTHMGPEEIAERLESVGRAVAGAIHITGEQGQELGAGQTGRVWFSGTRAVEYVADAERTAAARHARHGWATVGDRGWLDADGYLHLTGREGFTIISGGVNVEPEEVEGALALHPAVHDVAAVGVPDDDLGARVTILVCPAPAAEPGAHLRDELLAFADERLAGPKRPREVRFVDGLPRLPTGKLARTQLPDVNPRSHDRGFG